MPSNDVRLVTNQNAVDYGQVQAAQETSADTKLQREYSKMASTSDVSSSHSDQVTIKRTVNDIQRIFQEIIKNTNLTLDDLNDIMQYAGITTDTLQEMDDCEFKQLCGLFKLAIQHELSKGENIDIKNLKLSLISCKIAVHKGLKNPEEIEQFIKEYENKDLLDILKEKCPELKNIDFETITPQQLKDIFKRIITQTIGSGKKANNPQAFMDFFMGALGRCDDKEKAKIFYAFALLLKDEEMQGKIPEAYQNLVKTYGNIEELKKLINSVGPEILKLLGFDDKTINIINFNAINNLDDKQLGEVIDSFIKAFNEIDQEDLPILKKVLTAIDNGQIENLTEDELKVFGKYKTLIENTVNAIAVASNRPELSQELKEHYKNLLEKLTALGIDRNILNQVYLFFDTNPDLFNNISQDDFIKKINEITDNKFSETIGDTNPDNKYTPAIGNTDSGIGLPQRVSYETYQTALTTSSETSFDGSTPSTDYVVEKSSTNTDKFSKTKSIGSQTRAQLIDGLASGYIKMNQIIGECGSNLNNAVGKITLNYFEKLSSVAAQVNNLGKVHSFIARGKIIDECDYDYEKMDNRVVLTVTEKQEQEEKAQKKEKNQFEV